MYHDLQGVNCRLRHPRHLGGHRKWDCHLHRYKEKKYGIIEVKVFRNCLLYPI